jgi:hypothetical protein
LYFDPSRFIIQDTMNLSDKSSIEANSLALEEKQVTEELDPAERARILRKIDWHLLPFVTLFYLLCFL